MSEAAIVSVLTYKQYKKNKVDSVGKLSSGVRVKIFKKKLSLKDKQIGEIGCNSNLLSKFESNHKNNFEKNFYLTGDIGYLSNDYLYLTGRKKKSLSSQV